MMSDSGATDAYSRNLLWLLLLGFVVANLASALLWHIGHTMQPTMFGQFLTVDLQNGGDSWGTMAVAHEWLTAHPGGRVYQAIFFGQHIRFQYPLTSLLLFKAIDLLPARPKSLLDLISWYGIWAQSAVMGLIAVDLAGRARVAMTRNRQVGIAAVTALMTLTFFPILRAFVIGQAQVWFDGFFFLACLFWLKGYWTRAGAMIGIICIFKPQLGLLLAWAVLRRNWRFAAGFMCVTVPAGLAALHFYGLRNNLDYLSVLGFLSRHGEIFYPNQSVNGLLSRMVNPIDSRIWHGDSFPPYNPLVYYGTALSSAILVFLGLFFRVQSEPRSFRSLLLAALAFTMASPVAWEHHYGILLPVLICLAADAARLPWSYEKAVRVMLFAASYTLVGQDFFMIVMELFPPNSLAYSFYFLAAIGALASLATFRAPFPASSTQDCSDTTCRSAAAYEHA
jgi:hypothetical protein